MREDETMTTPAEHRLDERLWFAVLAPPLAWSAQLLLSWALVQPACGDGSKVWLYVVTIAAALVAAAGLALAWHSRSGVTIGDVSRRQREQFMAQLGILISGLFLFMILIAGVAPLVLEACP